MHTYFVTFQRSLLQLKCTWSSISPTLGFCCGSIDDEGVCILQTKKDASRGAVSPGQVENAHVISSTGCHPKIVGFEVLVHHRLCQIWPQATYLFSKLNSWKDANLLTTKTLYERQMAGWKTKINNSSTTESKLWRNVGSSAFQLNEAMLKVTKYDVHILWLTISGNKLFERHL